MSDSEDKAVEWMRTQERILREQEASGAEQTPGSSAPRLRVTARDPNQVNARAERVNSAEGLIYTTGNALQAYGRYFESREVEFMRLMVVLLERVIKVGTFEQLGTATEILERASHLLEANLASGQTHTIPTDLRARLLIEASRLTLDMDGLRLSDPELIRLEEQLVNLEALLPSNRSTWILRALLDLEKTLSSTLQSLSAASD